MCLPTDAQNLKLPKYEKCHAKTIKQLIIIMKWNTEAVAQKCSVKKVFLKIWQNSQENTCAGVYFSITLQASGLQLYLKETLAKVFSIEFCEIFKNIYFYRTPLVTASGNTNEGYSIDTGRPLFSASVVNPRAGILTCHPAC